MNESENQKKAYHALVNFILSGCDTSLRKSLQLPDLLRKMKEFYDYSRKRWSQKFASSEISILAMMDNFLLDMIRKIIKKIKTTRKVIETVREIIEKLKKIKNKISTTNINFEVKTETIEKLKSYLRKIAQGKIVFFVAVILCLTAISYFFKTDKIVAYGDAESHLDIAKRVVDSLTPGLGQIGGIWLPLPHILMTPFVEFDFLWRTGLAGAFISGAAFIVSSFFIFRFVYLLTENRLAAFFAFLVFALNPNMLYMQSTPMTEPLLIALFLMSSYYFVRSMQNQEDIFSLILAAVFGFLATLTRYEGWFLVLFEAVSLIAFHLQRGALKKLEGKLVLFCTLAFFGIVLWLFWGYLILGDPLYFTNSPFSAKSQQNNWLIRGELPAYHNFPLSFLYYFVTAMSNVGVFIFAMALAALFLFLKNKTKRFEKILIAFLLLAPAIFYVVTLYMGQSVIFIPHLTPVGYEWRLFNVRYGLMMVPVAAILLGWLFSRVRIQAKLLIFLFFLMQFGLYAVGYSQVITLEDGTVGLSHAKRPDAEQWIAKHYDSGLVLLDDYARTLSIIRSGIPMHNVIYIGNQYYWIDSLRNPDKWATWVIMQRDDAVWKAIYDKPEIRGRLFAHFNKEYTSKEILIFKKTR